GMYKPESNRVSGPPGAVIVGRFLTGEQPLTADISTRIGARATNMTVVVNDLPRVVIPAPDQSFVIKELPVGTIALGFERSAAHGYITLDQVIAGEVIELRIVEGGQTLEVSLA